MNMTRRFFGFGVAATAFLGVARFGVPEVKALPLSQVAHTPGITFVIGTDADVIQHKCLEIVKSYRAEDIIIELLPEQWSQDQCTAAMRANPDVVLIKNSLPERDAKSVYWMSACGHRVIMGIIADDPHEAVTRFVTPLKDHARSAFLQELSGEQGVKHIIVDTRQSGEVAYGKDSV